MIGHWEIYAGIFTISVLVVTLAWRTFFSGASFGDLRRSLYDLSIETKSVKWNSIGELLERGVNESIFRLCFLQYQLLHYVRWLFVAMLLAILIWIIRVAINPDYVLTVIQSYKPNHPIDFSVGAAIVLLLAIVIFGFFVTGYKARLVELAKQMNEDSGNPRKSK